MEDDKVWLFIGQTIDKIKNNSTNTEKFLIIKKPVLLNKLLTNCF